MANVPQSLDRVCVRWYYLRQPNFLPTYSHTDNENADHVVLVESKWPDKALSTAAKKTPRPPNDTGVTENYYDIISH